MDKLMNSSVRGSSSSTDHVKVVMGSCGDTFSSNSSDGGGGDGGESLLHPPKNTKYSSSSLLLHPAYADNATDEYGTDDSVAEEIVDIVDIEQVEEEEPNNLTKKIFSAAVSSIPLVDKFHDFITGNACWSPSSAAGGENGHGGGGGGIALLVPNAICADGDIMEMVDNVLPSSSSAKATTTTTPRRHKNNIVSKKKTKRRKVGVWMMRATTTQHPMTRRRLLRRTIPPTTLLVPITGIISIKRRISQWRRRRSREEVVVVPRNCHDHKIRPGGGEGVGRPHPSLVTIAMVKVYVVLARRDRVHEE